MSKCTVTFKITFIVIISYIFDNMFILLLIILFHHFPCSICSCLASDYLFPLLFICIFWGTKKSNNLRGAPERSSKPEPSESAAATSSGHRWEQQAAVGRLFPASMVQQSRSWSDRSSVRTHGPSVCLSVCTDTADRWSVSPHTEGTASHERGVFLTASTHTQSASAAEICEI